jgi:hypothetical protein
MAERDDQQPDRRDQTSWGLPWKEALGYVSAIVLVGGLFVYSLLSSLYELFYGRLGVDPNDIGLTYAGTLARSSGFVSAYIIVAIMIFTIRYLLMRMEEPSLLLSRLYMLGVALLVVIAFGWPSLKAKQAANAVEAGQPVGPIVVLSPFELPLLAIRADPVTVEPSGKPNESPATDRLQHAKLLYLGQTGGTVVLYNAATQRAVYVPASEVILQVANCRAKPPPNAPCE